MYSQYCLVLQFCARKDTPGVRGPEWSGRTSHPSLPGSTPCYCWTRRRCRKARPETGCSSSKQSGHSPAASVCERAAVVVCGGQAVAVCAGDGCFGAAEEEGCNSERKLCICLHPSRCVFLSFSAAVFALRESGRPSMENSTVERNNSNRTVCWKLNFVESVVVVVAAAAALHKLSASARNHH